MLEKVNYFFNQFSSFAQINPVVSGILGLWGIAVVTFLCRELPVKAMKFFVKHFTIRIVIYSSNDSFHDTLKWLEENNISEKMRSLRLSGTAGDKIISAGFGDHYFFFNNHPFKITRSTEDKGSLYELREKLELITIGRTQTNIRKLLKTISPDIVISMETKIYKWSEGYWEYSHSQVNRKLETVILEDKVKSKLLSHLDNFKKKKCWYQKHGIPYRTGICLYGPPGTGKTSLVKALCDTEKRNLFILNLSTLTDDSIARAFDTVDREAVLLIEDIDTFLASNNRSKSTDSTSATSKLTLSGLLNAIDGVSNSDGRILIVSTNHIESLDPAILRSGRIDLMLKLDFLTNETAKTAMNRFFPGFDFDGLEVRKNITPADLQKLVLTHEDDCVKVSNEILLGERDVELFKSSLIN